MGRGPKVKGVSELAKRKADSGQNFQRWSHPTESVKNVHLVQHRVKKKLVTLH